MTALVVVTTALLGILTFASETPSTPLSADRTFFTQELPHFIPVMVSLTVFVSASSDLTSFWFPITCPAVTTPRGRAAKAQSASALYVFVIFFVGYWLFGCLVGLKDEFPDLKIIIRN